MIYIQHFFPEEYEKLNDEVTKYINSVLADIVLTTLELLRDVKESLSSNGVPSVLESVCPPALIREDHQKCENRIHELYELISSSTLRRRIKPIYQYILFHCIEDFLESMHDAISNGEDGDWFPLDAGLEQEIISQFGEEEGEEAIEAITDIDYYLEIAFPDWDFLPEFLNQLVAMSMENSTVFQFAMSYEELDGYTELMDVDLRDCYLEYRKKMSPPEPPPMLVLSRNILKAVIMIQQNKRYYGKGENEINDGIRDALNMVYTIKDQTRHGESETGKDAGEVVFLIFNNDHPIALMEALKLDSLNKSYLKGHIEKALISYDPVGYPYIYILIYCSANDFHGFWMRCLDYLKEYDFTFPIHEDLEETLLPYAETKFAALVLKRNGNPVIVHFIAAHMR